LRRLSAERGFVSAFPHGGICSVVSTAITQRSVFLIRPPVLVAKVVSSLRWQSIIVHTTDWQDVLKSGLIAQITNLTLEQMTWVTSALRRVISSR
jgi:hypothetical protein